MSDTGIKPVWPGWKTEEVLGQGTYGAVYRIERDLFGTKEQAALKVISITEGYALRNDGYDDARISAALKDRMERISGEYLMMKKMNGSANIVNCDDILMEQRADGMGVDVLIKMELLTPLGDALPKGEIPEKMAIELGKDMAKALVLCSKNNIIHRDIKPANIFLSPNGDYKLGDFGVARTMESTMSATRTGTFDYMSPEVYIGRPYGAGADIYSLGLVLYWMMNDRCTPFLPLPPEIPKLEDKEAALNKRMRGDALPEPKNGSPELKQIILKACAYKPEDRYSNAQEMLDDLQKLSEGEKVKVKKQKNPKKLWKLLAVPAAAAAIALGIFLPKKLPAVAVKTETPAVDFNADAAEEKQNAWTAAEENKELNEKTDVEAAAAPAGSWELKNGVLTVSCSGNPKSAWPTEYPWEGQKNDVTEVRLESGVTEIPDEMFSGMTSLKTVALPDTLKSIGQSAFSGCSQLTDVVFPAAVQLESDSFGNCAGLAPTWSLENGVLTISGSGPMENAWPDGFPWTEKKDEIREVKVENGVLTVADNAFSDFTALEKVTLADTVGVIGDSAFYRCENLTEMAIPTNTLEIKNGAFNGCTALASVTFPSRLRLIGENAFSGCTYLKEAVLPDTLLSLGDNTFQNCTALSLISVPSLETAIGRDCFLKCDMIEMNWWLTEDGVLMVSGIGSMKQTWGSTVPWESEKAQIKRAVVQWGVTDVMDNAFRNCTQLTEAEIAETVTSVGSYAFGGCTAMKQVRLSQQANDLGEGAFCDCESLREIALPGRMTTINPYLLNNCKSLSKISGPSGVSVIGEYAFCHCESITDIALPRYLALIGDCALSYCGNLGSISIPSTQEGKYASQAGVLFIKKPYELLFYPGGKAQDSYVIPDKVETISPFAFRGCTKLKTLTISTTVRKIGDGAFAGSSITDFDVPTSHFNFVSEDGVLYNKNRELLAYPVGRSASNYDISESVEHIKPCAFEGCKYLKSVYIPDSVTAIYSRAFADCTALDRIELPDSVQVLDDEVFSGCTSLKTAMLPGAASLKALSVLNNRLFYHCTSLTNVEMSSAIVRIYDSVFEGCTSLRQIELPEGLKSVGKRTFKDSGLTSIELPEKMITIGAEAFEGCRQLTEIKIPSQVNEIGDGVFSDCSALSSVSILSQRPGMIVPNMFTNCTSLASFTVPEAVTLIPHDAFRGCTALSSITFSEKIQSIQENAFYGCTALDNVTFPGQLSIIYDSAFRGCSGLKTMTFNSKLATIGRYAFADCTSLTAVKLPETLKNLNEFAFSRDRALASVSINAKLDVIGGGAFSGCDSLKEIVVDDGNFHFSAGNGSLYTEKLTELLAFGPGGYPEEYRTPEGIAKIGKNMAAYNNGPKKLIVGGSVTRIDSSAFYGSRIGCFVLESGVREIGDSAFASNTDVTMIVIPDTVKTIGRSAFDGCRNLVIYFQGSRDAWKKINGSGSIANPVVFNYAG